MSIPHFINGERVAGRSARTAPVFDPAQGEQTNTVPLASRDDVADAVAAAKHAFPEWAATPPPRRVRILNRFLRILDDNMEVLAKVVTSEHGKLLGDARGEVHRGLEMVEFALAAPQLLKGEFTENIGTGMDSHSVRQPLGVIAGITPFNFPVMIPMWMFPIAIACGNCFVLKPSERDPSASLLLAEWAKQAGLPNGVLNVVHGDKEAVDALIAHPNVAAVSFVGSTPTARHVYETAAAHGKRAQALGGAKNHMVIMPDADLDHVVDALMGAAYGAAGERCMAISVAVPVGEQTAERLIERLAPRVRALRVGSGFDSQMEMGPLVTRQHVERIRGYIDAGIAEGARLVVDGRGLSVPGHEKGFFLGGTLFDHVTRDMRVYKEEIFGPVLVVTRAPDMETALRFVNEHTYGNGVAIFTRDGETAREFTHRVQVGMIGVNVPIPAPMSFHSFGGWRASLFGDHHIHGPEGIRFYTRLKTISTRWPSGASKGPQFSMPTLR